MSTKMNTGVLNLLMKTNQFHFVII